MKRDAPLSHRVCLEWKADSLNLLWDENVNKNRGYQPSEPEPLRVLSGK